MNKLEYHILKLFQEMVLKKQYETRYLILDENLIAVVKGEKELEVYLKTEIVLEGRVLESFTFSKIVEGLYKLVWTDQFLYLVGEKNKEDVHHSIRTKEIELLRVSSNPLSNCIKTL